MVVTTGKSIGEASITSSGEVKCGLKSIGDHDAYA